MRLILLHKILIAAAATLGVLLALWGFHDYATSQRSSSIGLAIVGIVLAVALAIYFRGINKRYAAIAEKERH
jgi:hypothetical protein